MPLRAGVLCGIAVLVLGGCFRFARTIHELPPGDWSSRLGDAAHARFIEERVPDRVQVEWDADMGRGLQVPVVVHGDLLIAVSGGGQVLTANAANGVQHWSRRFNAAVAGQVIRAGPEIYFATQHRNGTLYALDLHRGRRQWSERIGAPAAAAPVHADGTIYVGTNRDVQAYDAENGNVLWRVRIGGPAAQSPVIAGGELIVARGDSLYRIERRDGRINARIGLSGEPSAPIALLGDTLVIAMQPGIVAAYVDGGEREIWRQTLDAPVMAAPVVTRDGVFVLTRAADLYQLGRHTIRRIIALDGAATESLSITANGALIGTLDGRLVFVRMSGTIVWEERLDGSIRAPAAVYDGAVYAGTLNGRLVKLR